MVGIDNIMSNLEKVEQKATFSIGRVPKEVTRKHIETTYTKKDVTDSLTREFKKL